MLVIEINLTIFSFSSWLLDSGSSTHLCTSMQGLKEVREGEITLRVSNRARVAVVAVGTYPLRLPSGLSLIFKDCYYKSVASRNLIFISVLAQDNYNFHFNKGVFNLFQK